MSRLLHSQGRPKEVIPYVNDVLPNLDRPESSAMFRGSPDYHRVLQYNFMVCGLTGDRAGAEEARRELKR